MDLTDLLFGIMLLNRYRTYIFLNAYTLYDIVLNKTRERKFKFEDPIPQYLHTRESVN